MRQRTIDVVQQAIQRVPDDSDLVIRVGIPGRTRTLIWWSSSVSGMVATSAAVAATRRSGRSAYPTTHTVSAAVTTSAAPTSATVVTFLRAMIWLARLSDTPTNSRSAPAALLSTW